MKLIYLAGPYRAKTERGLVENIRRAEELALKVWLSGAACICPHTNTAFFGGTAPDELWLQGDLEMLRRCDAVMCTENWRQSAGAHNEVKLANELGLPVFETIDDLQQWLAHHSDQARTATAATHA